MKIELFYPEYIFKPESSIILNTLLPIFPLQKITQMISSRKTSINIFILIGFERKPPKFSADFLPIVSNQFPPAKGKQMEEQT